MHLIGNMNGQIILYKKKILVQVVIVNIHHDIIVVMNGIVNGYQIKLEMIRNEVRKNRQKTRLNENFNIPIFDIYIYLLAEARPYSFIIPEPYLAVNNDDENEWNLTDEKLNDTDDAVQKRIVLFILSICKVVSLVYLFIYISFTFWWLSVSFLYILMVIYVVEYLYIYIFLVK